MKSTIVLSAFTSFPGLVSAALDLLAPVLDMDVPASIERRGATVSWKDKGAYSSKKDEKIKWEGFACAALDAVNCPHGIIQGSAHHSPFGKGRLREERVHVTVRPQGTHEDVFLHVFDNGEYDVKPRPVEEEAAKPGSDGLTTYQRLRQNRREKRKNLAIEEKLAREAAWKAGNARQINYGESSSIQRGGQRKEKAKRVPDPREGSETKEGSGSLGESEIGDDSSPPWKVVERKKRHGVKGGPRLNRGAV